MTAAPISESEFRQLLEFWDAGQIQSMITPKTGTINTIRILSTSKGAYVLRIYHHRDLSRIEREHRVVFWLHEKGIPAVTPLKTVDGTTFVEHDGHFITLLPYLSDSQVCRDDLQPAQIEAMGSFLGRLHNVLEEYPVSEIPAVKFELDRSATLSGINRLEGVVRSIESPQPTDKYALQRLIARREWLQGRSSEDASGLCSLPFQVVHGDFQESNVFFKNSTVSAVIDWDKVCAAPDAWEVIRTLHLMLGFQAGSSIAFLKAYREERPLSINDLDVAAHCYGLMRAYDLWLFEGVYDGGNNRLRQFLKPGNFVPVECDWGCLRSELRQI